ncbi:hypothetical protein [Bradyrhizobium algeriense]|uniref:hypothetical protein n=1 Tax=Bradyrhizobium algeriense TaxID=634784 RepID=UPI00167E6FEE|nr:hypothetical protein [Bradyrhizobium algeriense]
MFAALDVSGIDFLVEPRMQGGLVEFAFPPGHEHRGKTVAGDVGIRRFIEEDKRSTRN